MERFSADFEDAVADILRYWRISPQASEALVETIASGADVSRRSEQEKRVNPHITCNKFSPGLSKAITSLLLENPEVAEMVAHQRKELGYA